MVPIKAKNQTSAASSKLPKKKAIDWTITTALYKIRAEDIETAKNKIVLSREMLPEKKNKKIPNIKSPIAETLVLLTETCQRTFFGRAK